MFKLHKLLKAAAFMAAGLASAGLLADDIKVAVHPPRCLENLADSAITVMSAFEDAISKERGVSLCVGTNETYREPITDLRSLQKDDTIFNAEALKVPYYSVADFLITSKLVMQSDGVLLIAAHALSIQDALLLGTVQRHVKEISSIAISKACQDLMKELVKNMRTKIPSRLDGGLPPSVNTDTLTTRIQGILKNFSENGFWNVIKPDVYTTIKVDFTGLTTRINRVDEIFVVSGTIKFTIAVRGNGVIPAVGDYKDQIKALNDLKKDPFNLPYTLEINTIRVINENFIEREIIKQVRENGNAVITGFLSQLPKK